MSKRCPDCGGFLISYDKTGHKCKVSQTPSSAGASPTNKLLNIKSDIQKRKADKESAEMLEAQRRLEAFAFPLPKDLDLSDEERMMAVHLQDFGIPSVEEYIKTLENTKSFAKYLLSLCGIDGINASSRFMDLSNTQRRIAESDRPVEQRRVYAQYLLDKCDFCKNCPELHIRINDEQEERRLDFSFHHPGTLSPYNNAWECCERIGADAPGCKKGVPMYHPGKFYLGWSCCQQMRSAAGCLVRPRDRTPVSTVSNDTASTDNTAAADTTATDTTAADTAFAGTAAADNTDPSVAAVETVFTSVNIAAQEASTTF
jgi:hypothetical protein